MCGISGIINLNGAPVARADIEVINDLAAHRGPDGAGVFLADHLALGHRRLAIIDRSSAGHQPMHYRDRYVITYNGEIYNYLELRRQLLLLGYAFSSTTDTEVILAAYDKWGSDCVSHFNGMWAFALYDQQQRQVFCSRDRFGVKPFYYANDAERFVFGSEIKQVLAGRSGAAIANVSMVRDFLVEGYLGHTHETFFKGVFALRAGHNLLFSLTTNRFSETNYYTPTARDDLADIGEHDAAEQLLTDLQRAVHIQLRADVSVGVCLSGGLDSSSIAALAAPAYHAGAEGKLQAIHAKSSEQAMDESAFAQAVADGADIALSVIEPSTAEFIDAIDEVVYCQEEPFATPSIFMQYFVFQKARQHGCKVMLDGQGGDELLLGYERYYSAHLHAMSCWRAARELLLIERHSSLSLRAILANLVYFSSAAIRIKNLQRKLRFLKPQYTRDFPNIARLSKGVRDIRLMQKMEIDAFQLPHLLRYADRNSMRHSVEARVPFLDHHLVETCLGISHRFKIRHGWTKHVLRVAMGGLVGSPILWRKSKMGFESPEASWIHALRPAMELAINESPLVAALCARRPDLRKLDRATFWKLYSIAKWESVYAVQLESESTSNSTPRLDQGADMPVNAPVVPV